MQAFPAGLDGAQTSAWQLCGLRRRESWQGSAQGRGVAGPSKHTRKAPGLAGVVGFISSHQRSSNKGIM